MRVTGVSTLQAIACFVVAAAGLVPVVHKNRPFWGLYCASFNHGAPRVHQVDSASPAHSAGLRVDDVILTANGSAVDHTGLMSVLEGLKPGDAAQLRVKRGEAEVDLSVTGVEPPVAVIYYPTVWHPIAGGVALALGLLVLATQPLRPPPRWRAILLAVAGFGLAIGFFLAILNESPFLFLPLRRYHNINWGAAWHFEQSGVGLGASLVLSVSGAWELRRLLSRRHIPGGSGPPNQPLQQTGPA